MRINIVNKQLLDKLIDVKSNDGYRPEGVDLKDMLKSILLQANRFVPSESGSILLDASALSRRREKKDNLLYFVACFGKGGASVIGRTLPVNVGIAGSAYASGRPYISKRVMDDSHFYPAIDRSTKYHTKSIICSPIKIKGEPIGVIELINKLRDVNYEPADLTLLKIFAEYTSILIQNSLDAKKFGELSIRDNLTGLYNDRYIFHRLTKEVARSLRKNSDVSLIFMDLDRFKEVNDAHGHLAGSRVLTEIGEILNETLRRTSAVCARYGGDEFTVILPGKTLDEAREHAERIRKAIEGYTFLERKHRGIRKALKIKGVITGSLGVSSLRSNIVTKAPASDIRDSLIRLADAAMYRSKDAGKNRVTQAHGKIDPASPA